jgi:hypothetical protein
LRQGVTVIPVLVAGAEVPDPEDLPEALRPITCRHGAELSDVRWAYDVERLLSMLDQLGLLLEAGAAIRQIAPDTVEARFRRLLVEGAHHGVLPGPALELATYHRPEWEVTWTPAPVPSPKSAPPPTEHAPPAARSLLLRAALILVPLAALAAAIKWLVGCAVDYPVPEGDEPAGETVACTVFAPTAVAAGEAFLVQVFAHLPLQYADARGAGHRVRSGRDETRLSSEPRVAGCPRSRAVISVGNPGR